MINPESDHEQTMTQLAHLNEAVFGDQDNLGMKDKVDEMYDLVKGAKMSWKILAWVIGFVAAATWGAIKFFSFLKSHGQ